jgi:hypothetical protein
MNPPDQPTPALAPTPRTDATASESDCGIDSFGKAVPSNFARTLERELIAVQAECERLTTEILERAALNREVMRERDSLESELARLRADLERFTGHGLLDCHAICDQRDAAVAERDSLRAEVERLKQVSGGYYDSSKAWMTRAEKAEADNAKWQKLLLMSRDDREIDLISEIEEQARLLGMSGEREADLLGKLGRLEKDKERLDWLHLTADGITWQTLDNTHLVTRDAIDAAMKGTP